MANTTTTTWKHGRGRPRPTWQNCVSSDLKPLHFTYRDALVAAQNRVQWRGLVRDVMQAPIGPGRGSLPYRR